MTMKQEINYDLIDRLILKLKRMRHPEHFHMPDWIKVTDCGTAACYGGHGLIMEKVHTPRSLIELTKKRGGFNRIFNQARTVFGLTPTQAQRLFNLGGWPFDLWRDFETAKNPKQKRDIAIKRLERFKATKGAE